MANGIKPSLQQLMGALKADLAVDLQKYIRQRQQQAALKSETFLQNANLADLLASADKTELLARARNRALVAGKNQQLPAILRDKKTEELAALVVKIEQTILDLNHECEVAKDQAQQATAANGDARQTDELRGLAICYRERIELLKSILTALKDEMLEDIERTVHTMQDEATVFADPNDRASQESDIALELRNRDRERKLIKKIDESIARIDSGEYGYCDSCGVEIGLKRLEARPTATMCIDCKTLEELREKQVAK